MMTVTEPAQFVSYIDVWEKLRKLLAMANKLLNIASLLGGTTSQNYKVKTQYNKYDTKGLLPLSVKYSFQKRSEKNAVQGKINRYAVEVLGKMGQVSSIPPS